MFFGGREDVVEVGVHEVRSADSREDVDGGGGGCGVSSEDFVDEGR